LQKFGKHEQSLRRSTHLYFHAANSTYVDLDCQACCLSGAWPPAWNVTSTSQLSGTENQRKAALAKPADEELQMQSRTSDE
jgi:hypothetical protein